jgi:hypothetical protein
MWLPASIMRCLAFRYRLVPAVRHPSANQFRQRRQVLEVIGEQRFGAPPLEDRDIGRLAWCLAVLVRTVQEPPKTAESAGDPNYALLAKAPSHPETYG